MSLVISDFPLPNPRLSLLVSVNFERIQVLAPDLKKKKKKGGRSDRIENEVNLT